MTLTSTLTLTLTCLPPLQERVPWLKAADEESG